MSQIVTRTAQVAGYVVLTDAMFAAVGAANGATGSAILKGAGLDGYDTLSATRNGAVGGAVLGPVVSPFVCLALLPFVKSAPEGSKNPPWPMTMAFYSAAAAACTAAGSGILQSAGHKNVMAAGPSAAAGAVGSVGSAILGIAGAASLLGILAGVLHCANLWVRRNAMASNSTS